MRIAFVAAAAAGLFLAGAAQAFPAASKTIKDWDAVCDNTGLCTAFGYSADDGPTPSFIKLTRDAGPDAAPAVEITFDAGDTQPDQTWTLGIDGKTVPNLGVISAKGSDSGAWVQLTPAQAATLIDAIRNGQHLDLLGAGKPLGSISLAGSAATLLWIDVDQGRVGTVTALGRKGTGPASVVPPPAAPPVVVAAAPVSQAGLPTLAPPSLIKGNADCDMDTNPAPTTPDDIVARLAPGVVLWGPECEMAAYNEVNVFFLGDEHGGHIRPLHLPDYAGAVEPGAATKLINAAFDPATQTLQAFDKGRGIGDCGSTASWVWDGKAFQLVNETLMANCHMVTMEDWPTIYVATQK